MATADTQLQPNLPHLEPSTNGTAAVTSSQGNHEQLKFDPARHLRYVPPEKQYTFTDLGLEATDPPPPNDMCITEPFDLFTEEAVRLMRRELFQPAVFDNYMHSWARAPCVIRGSAPTVSFLSFYPPTLLWQAWTDGYSSAQVCKFIYDAWMHPATLEAVSNAAGIDLIPVMDWEIAHVNIQVGAKGLAGVRELGEKPAPPLSVEEVASLREEQDNDRLVDDWHVDSYQFVCVVMLSDASTMAGGETAIETGSGKVVKMRAAQMGGGVVLQGGSTRHAAFRTIGANERVTMVTSFRPKNLALRDHSTLRNIDFETSDMKEVHYQWTSYRLKLVEDRIEDMLQKLTERKKNLQEGQEMIKRDELNEWVEEQVYHLRQTVHEMFDRVKDKW